MTTKIMISKDEEHVGIIMPMEDAELLKTLLGHCTFLGDLYSELPDYDTLHNKFKIEIDDHSGIISSERW